MPVFYRRGTQMHVTGASAVVPECSAPPPSATAPRHIQTTNLSSAYMPKIWDCYSNFSTSSDLVLLGQAHHRDAAILDGSLCSQLSLLLSEGVVFRMHSAHLGYCRIGLGQLGESQHLRSPGLLLGQGTEAWDGKNHLGGRSCHLDVPSD